MSLRRPTIRLVNPEHDMEQTTAAAIPADTQVVHPDWQKLPPEMLRSFQQLPMPLETPRDSLQSNVGYQHHHHQQQAQEPRRANRKYTKAKRAIRRAWDSVERVFLHLRRRYRRSHKISNFFVAVKRAVAVGRQRPHPDDNSDNIDMGSDFNAFPDATHGGPGSRILVTTELSQTYEPNYDPDFIGSVTTTITANDNLPDPAAVAANTNTVTRVPTTRSIVAPWTNMEVDGRAADDEQQQQQQGGRGRDLFKSFGRKFRRSIRVVFSREQNGH